MTGRAWRTALTFNVAVLAATSLLTDVSSEMILPLLPFFVVSIGGNALILGFIEGAGETVVSFVKVLAGHRSDATGRRKPFVAVGYGLSTLSKAFLSVASSWAHILFVRIGDRMGKGLRDPARDALIADSVPAEVRGTAFGFHRAMDTTGAVLGPILAIVLIAYGLTFNQVFLVAALPAAAAFAVVLLVRERPFPAKRRPLFAALRALPPPLKRYLAVVTVFSMPTFTVPLFLLRAGEITGAVGNAILLPSVIALYVAFNVVYAALSFEVGRLSDRLGRVPMILAGYSIFAAAAVGFAVNTSPAALLPLFLLLGASFGFLDGSQRALAADLVPASQRGTSLGTFHAVTGLSKLPSGVAAGAVYTLISPAAAFGLGGALAVTAAGLLLWAVPHEARTKP